MKTFLPGLLCALLLTGCPAVLAQEKEILSLTGAASLEELDEDEYERLSALLASPVPVNIVSPARLQSCGLFTRFQAVSVTDYRNRNGDILSATELGLVDGFSPETAAALAPFLSFAPAGKPGQTPRERSRKELVLRSECRNDLAGYAAKFRYEREGRMSLSATARAKATERPGAPDSWSFNATRAFRRRTGKVMIGDFNARFGQGLALWNGFSLGGLTTAESFARHPTGLSPAWSLSPDGPLRGLAADLGIRRVTLTAVTAFPGLRARMDGDPKAVVSCFGALNGHWTGRNAESSATVLLASPASGLSPKLAADFRWTPGKWGYFGEGALDLRSKSVAGVCGLVWTPAWQQHWTLVVRHYPAAFGSALTGGVRTGSRCSGESGLAAGIRLPWLRFTADYARFPAKGQAQMRLLCILPLNYQEKWALTPRVSLRWKNGARREEYRLEAAYAGTPWQVKVRADAVRATGFAWHACAETGCKTDRLSLYLRAGIFKVDDWDDRIYVYERDVPGCFNVPARYGRGYNASLCGGWRWKRHKLYLRIAGTRYVTDKPGRSEARIQYSLQW